jgi:hypothetical protein
MADYEEKKDLTESTQPKSTKSSEEFSSEVDPELRELLFQWRVPESSSDLDQKVLTAYRSQIAGVSRWKRLFGRRLSVPVPVAAALLIGMVFLASRALTVPKVVRLEVPSPPRVVRVEVPIVHEKIVTRTVYRRPPEEDNQKKPSDQQVSPESLLRNSEAIEDPQIAARLAGFDPVEKIQLKVISWGGRKQ